MLDPAYYNKIEKFLCLSSSTVYSPSGNRKVKEDRIFSGEPFDNYYPVGWMKRYTEILCRTYSEKLFRPMCTIMLRPTDIYGEHDDFEFATSRLIPVLIQKVVDGYDPVEGWGTGADVRDIIYVQDVIDGIVLALEK